MKARAILGLLGEGGGVVDTGVLGMCGGAGGEMWGLLAVQLVGVGGVGVVGG